MSERPTSLQDLIRLRQHGGFVGRLAQLSQFQENLRLPVEDLRRRFLVTVHGAAGIGKSFLLSQFVRMAGEQGCCTASVDESMLDVLSAMEAVAAQLGRQELPCKEFTKRSDAYRRYQHDLGSDPAMTDGLSSTLTRSAVRIGLHAAEGVPLVGPFAKEINTDAVADEVDRLRVYLNRKLRNRQDVQLMLAPVDELTPVFLDNLRAVAARRPVALFFDTYERTGLWLDLWLRNLLLGRYGDLPMNLVITIAGQYPLDVNTWGDYLGVRLDVALEVFTEAEARELLASKGVTDAGVVDVILGLTDRLPVLVAMLAETRPDRADAVNDPSDDAVDRFLKWEPDERRRQAALRGALSRPAWTMPSERSSMPSAATCT